MRYLILLILSVATVACMSDMAVEDDPSADMYPSSAPSAPTVARDTVAVAADTEAPTPYGMVIQPDNPDQQAKGAPAAAGTEARRNLTGNWVNTTDPDETVAFTPTHYRTFYQGELLVEEDMTFHARCPEACSGGSSTGEPCFTISGPAQTDCYGIVRLTDDILELQVLGVSTETVVYRRAD